MSDKFCMNRRMDLFFIVLFILQSNAFVSGFWFSRPEVCYDHIGCFSNAAPYDNANGRLPESPDHILTEFLLYTRQNPTDEFLLNAFDVSNISHSHFDGSKQTVFIIHGYNDYATSDLVQAMKEELLKKDDLNVIAVNWEKGADNLIYAKAAANTRVVGAIIGELLKNLHSTGHSSYSKFHLVGHSLGAHISGYAGAIVDGRIAKITGLDPAGPCFENQDPITRLDPSDAHYVEVIHTDGSSLIQLGFGLDKAIGHADFYPNGGVNQPGCSRKFRLATFSLITGRIGRFTATLACSHMRSFDLFTESINSQCAFIGKPCDTKEDFDAGLCTGCGNGCAEMGYNGQQDGHGKYYFSTNSAAPFCEQ
ncbi:pancreatic triacylglycerol lipase-like [Mytilus californianus]|uniref:pancreatic triacylglycerol lipase-like n=1 Tax=Mytilus californianus TaxID=6549 RepID=UPI0022478D8C|nr:pancreatic triacylglycerol lipase-like [Mytilus californianus]